MTMRHWVCKSPVEVDCMNGTDLAELFRGAAHCAEVRKGTGQLVGVTAIYEIGGFYEMTLTWEIDDFAPEPVPDQDELGETALASPPGAYKSPVAPATPPLAPRVPLGPYASAWGHRA